MAPLTTARRVAAAAAALAVLTAAAPAAHADGPAIAPAAGSSADFGVPVVGQASTRRFVLTNPSSHAFQLVRGNLGDLSGHGSLTNESDCPVFQQTTATLGPGQSCMLALTWHPSQPGPVTTSWYLTLADITTDDYYGTNALQLKVNAATAALAIDRSALAFDPQPVGVLSTSQAVKVSALGATRTARAYIDGADASFVIARDTCSPAAVSGDCSIAVRFAPEGVGPHAATLVVTEDGTKELHEIPLTGTGIPTPPGPKGDTGQQGIQGERGAQGIQGVKGDTGPQGPAGQIICRNTLAARAVCDLVFAPGSWKVAPTVARYTVLRAGRVVAKGTRRTQRRVRITLPRGLRHGHYVVKIRLGRSVVRQTVRL